jgi:hypothetical protein
LRTLVLVCTFAAMCAMHAPIVCFPCRNHFISSPYPGAILICYTIAPLHVPHVLVAF